MKNKVGAKGRKEQTEHVTLELLHVLALSMTAALLSCKLRSCSPSCCSLLQMRAFFRTHFAPTWTCASWNCVKKRTINIYVRLYITLMHRAAWSWWPWLLDAHIIWSKWRVKQVMVCHCVDTKSLGNGLLQWLICRWMPAYLMCFSCSVKSSHKL